MNHNAKPLDSEEREQMRSRFSRALMRPEIYLAHHSLGLPPDAMLTSINRFAELWFTQMDLAWDEWINEINRFCQNTVALIGMQNKDCVVMKTSCGQSLRAVLNALPADESLRPIHVVATRGEFDSIDFILKMYQDKGRAEVTWIEPTVSADGIPHISYQDIVSAISPETDLVIASLVLFNTGQVLTGWDEIAIKAKECGAFLLGDAYHAVGVIPVDLSGFDFLMGGSYKYTLGGPGACWLAINPCLLDSGELRTLDTGWFAKKDTFQYQRQETAELSDGSAAWLESTPPVITAYQANAGLSLIHEIGVERLRASSLSIQREMREAFRSFNIPVYEPENPAEFGAFSLMPHSDGLAFCEEMRSKGVSADARAGFVRFGPSITNRSLEFSQAGEMIASLL